MEQTISFSTPAIQPKSWRSLLRVLLGFLMLYLVVWVIRLIMGVGPNLLMKSLGVSPGFRAYIGSTLNYGVGIASYILLPAIALCKVLNIDPWTALFPRQTGWWKDLLFGFLLITFVLTVFFAIEVKMGGLIVESWSWQRLALNALLRTAWVGLLINIGVAIGEETLFRGYLLTGLRVVLGKCPALILMMVIFGLFHIPAYRESGGMQSWTLSMAILLATLFGGLFGLIYLRTRSLWLPISLHFTWNFIENDVLNITGASNNPNLIGAMTRLQAPLSMIGLDWGNVVILEMLAFGLIALGGLLWLKYGRDE